MVISDDERADIEEPLLARLAGLEAQVERLRNTIKCELTHIVGETVSNGQVVDLWWCSVHGGVHLKEEK